MVIQPWRFRLSCTAHPWMQLRHTKAPEHTSGDVGAHGQAAQPSLQTPTWDTLSPAHLCATLALTHGHTCPDLCKEESLVRAQTSALLS